MKRSIVAFVLVLLVLPALAAGNARARLDKFVRDIHALTCSFVQVTRDAHGEIKSTLHGTLALAAPRQFRWQTQAPEEQVIVADGARVWIYDPELDQVTVRRQSSEEAHSPLSVLTDLSLMDKQFVASEAGHRDGLDWLRLTPRGDDTGFRYAELGFDASGELAGMRFENALGGESDIRFSDWQRNPVLQPSTFDFQPPAGADVIGDDVEVPEVHPLGN